MPLTPLDPSQYQEFEAAPSPAASPASAAPAAAPGGLVPLDANEVVALPTYADGSSPDAPVNKSPLDITDRLKLALGNEKGKLDYLKQKFGGATRDKHGDYLVRAQGIWHRVDPNGLGDPDAWEATKKIMDKMHMPVGLQMLGKGIMGAGELAKDVADNADLALQMGGAMGGAAAGTAVMPGIGTVIGAGLGAAGAEGLRTSLGRLEGTYHATPEEQLKDIGWEGLLALGGEAVALGAKPTFAMLRKSLGTAGDTMSSWAKDKMASLWGHLTGTSDWSMRRALDDAGAVIPKADEVRRAVGAAASPQDAVGLALDKQIGIVRRTAAQAKAALQSHYASAVKQLEEKVPNTFEADVGDMVKGVQLELEKAGLGQFVRRGQKGATRVLGLAEDTAAKAGRQAAEEFVPFSDEALAKALNTDPEQLPKILGPKAKEALHTITDTLNQYGKIGTLKGKKGAAKLMELRRAVSESLEELFAVDAPSNVKTMAAQVKESLSNRVVGAFESNGEGLGESYSAINKAFSSKADIVRELNRHVANGTEEQVIKKLVEKSASHRTLKEEAAALAELVGQNPVQAISDWEAAKGFLSYTPAKGGAGGSLGAAARFAAGLAQQTNARVVAKQIEYGTKSLDFIKSLPPKQLKAFLSNDEAIARMITPLVQAYDGEDQVMQQLLQGVSGPTGGTHQ